jgi:hypothetical protein
MSTSLPLFDRVFETGERAISASAVKRRAIQSQPTAPARRSDPDTAHEAANANQEVRGEQRTKVWEYLKSCGANGATDYEISVACGILRTSAGKRRKELVDLGLVEYAGFTKPTDTGSSAKAWRVKK